MDVAYHLINRTGIKTAELWQINLITNTDSAVWFPFTQETANRLDYCFIIKWYLKIANKRYALNLLPHLE
jgi:hypothetical protein